MAAPINLPVNAPANIDTPSTGRYNLFLNSSDSDSLYKKDSAGVSTPVVAAGTGTVTSVSFTGGLISVATATTTPALTVAGTSGGIPYFSSGSTWATSAALAANSIVIGGGAGVAPSTITTGTGVVTALGVNVGSAGAFVVNGGALGTPSSGTLTNCTGLVLTTGVTGVLPTANGGTGVNIATTALTLGTASSAVGSIVLQNATNANTITIQSGVTTSTHTLTLPVANASGVLTNNGSGTLTWTAASSGITVGTTTSTGANGRLLFSLSGVVNESASVYIDQSGTNFDVRLGRQIGAGGVGYTGSSNVLIGHWVAYNATSMGTNVIIGAGAAGVGSTISTGSNLVALGSEALGGSATNQFYTTAVGYWAGRGSTSWRGIYLGHAAGNGNTFQGIIIGVDPPNLTAAHQCIIGSNDANGYITDYYFNGITHTAPYSVVLHATHGSGTNVAAANMTLSGGAATGTGAGGYVKTTTSVKGASGTTVQSDTDRNTIIAKYVDVTGGAATTFGQLALATSSTNAGGEVLYTIHASDGTDTQSLTGVLKYDVVNKAGALTVTYSDVQNGAGACSAGTLTATVTATASGTNVLFQANAVSSLVETVLRVSFQVINNFGVATITSA